MRAGFAFALAGLMGFATACASTVPATPPITPGIPSSPRQVNVILKDYLFVPGIVDLVPGETVRLFVINGGLETHELVLGTSAVQDAWATAEKPAANPPPGPTPRVSVQPGLEGLRIVLRSGESTSVLYTVPRDVTEQLYLGCHIADHLERGMAGAVRFVGAGGVPVSASPASSAAAPSSAEPASTAPASPASTAP
jgi:hypothetical protein